MASLFFIVGIVLMVLFIFTIGKDKGFYQPKFEVELLFRNVGGLVEGAPVRFHGVNVGSVAQIDFTQHDMAGRKVKVTTSIYDKYRKQLEQGTRFTIRTEGVLGEKLIEIYSLDGYDLLDLHEPIIGEDPIDVVDMAQQFASLAASFTETAEEFSKVDIVNLTNVMEESSRALLVTSEGVSDMMADLKEITRKSKRMINRIEEKVIEGELFSVF